jgi:hypothetical protein
MPIDRAMKIQPIQRLERPKACSAMPISVVTARKPMV